ncbi:MAG TPA: PEPxxWA-CTERM sorting domain-containing protein [Caulobacteraceae bacterium]
MNWKATLATAALVSVAAFTAQAGVLLNDNFDTENGGVGQLNYNGFANFTVANAGSGGAVDLIGNGSFDFYPGNGLYVDMCGSSTACGVLTTNQVFGPGTYTITIDLGGNARFVGSDTTLVNFGTFSGSYSLTETQQQTETATVTLTSPSQLAISDGGAFGADVGNILFSVNVATAAVPEPAAWTLMLVGFGGLGAMLRRRARPTFA